MHMPYNEWAVPHPHTRQNDVLLNQCVVSLNEHRTIKCATMPLFHAKCRDDGKCPLSGAIRRQKLKPPVQMQSLSSVGNALSVAPSDGRN